MTKILNKINNPQDIKALTLNEIEQLSSEVREGVLHKVSQVGGHLGPNLAIVEAAVALHKVFNSPADKIVWDVSHQSYPHKILTGRKEGFLNPDKLHTITGYTAPDESEHDHFTVGHTSTSVSLATGLAQARNIKGGTENIIAVIGDGSLSGGEAFEGLNNAGRLNSNIIIVVNDNDMSIAVNQGSLYENLALLRQTEGKAELNFFKALGFDYHFVKDGNDVEELIATFETVKDTTKPTIVHINTLKGKGFAPAETNKENYHYSGPFNLETGEALFNGSPNYANVVTNHLMKIAETDDLLAVVDAAVPGGIRIQDFRQKYPNKYYDVGIAEAQGVTFTAAMASQGIHAVGIFRSTFIQRAYDQMFEDVCVDNNPAVFIIEGGAITNADVTHLGNFDIPMLSNIPNLVYLAPTNKQELEYMIDWAIAQTAFPVAIRTPENEIHEGEIVAPITECNKSLVTHEGEKVAIFGLGGFYQLAEKVAAELKTQHNIDATIVNPRFISGIDTTLIDQLQVNHDLIITLEDGQVEGGFGSKVAAYCGTKAVKVINYGATKDFTDRVSLTELYDRYRLNPEQIIEDIIANI